MQIKHIEYVLEVAKCQSISKAAKNLFIGQPTLSMAITTIEKELQNDIFYRTNKGVKLTNYGEKILPELIEIMKHNKTIELLSNVSATNGSKVQMASYPAGNSFVMPHIVGDMIEKYPQSSVHVIDVQSENIVRWLVANGNHIGFGSLSEVSYRSIVSEAENYGFICETLCKDNLSAYVHKNNPFSSESCIYLNNIKDTPICLLHTFLLPNENTFFRDFRIFNRVYSFSNYEALKRVLIDYKLMTIVPDLAFYNDPYVVNGTVLRKSVEDLQQVLINFIVYPKDEKKLNQVEQEILQSLRRFFQVYCKSNYSNLT